jgi:tRNA A64-2'-O-ribosylphosphate transferase
LGDGAIFRSVFEDDFQKILQGLTPKCFWDHRVRLMQADRSDLNATVKSIVYGSAIIPPNVDWAMPPSEISKTGGKLFVCSNVDLPSPLPSSLGATLGAATVAFLQISTSEQFAPSCTHQSPNLSHSYHLQLETLEGKRGQLKFLQSVLPQSMIFIAQHLRMGLHVCISCDTGKDLCVGVTLAALQRFFDDTGSLIQEGVTRVSRKCLGALHISINTVVYLADKQSIKTRLQWIISDRPLANPSRATLKRVNEFLLTPAGFSRPTYITSPTISM